MDHLVNQHLFGGIYRDKKILITGITGFKGSWLAKWLQMMGAKVVGIGLEPDTTPNHFGLLGLKYRCVDIRNTEKLGETIIEEQPDLVFHLAAQALVRKSYSEPVTTYDTNVLGSLNVYNACRSLLDLKGIVSITSDKVYENKEQYRSYKESDELGGYDMYSSSKACMEIMTSSYIRSYKNELNFPIVTARAGNVIGGGDWAADRLIPDLVRATKQNRSVNIRYPEAVRPWQHVLEPLSGYLVLGQQLLKDNSTISGAWNFGPSTQKYTTVKEVLQIAQSKWEDIQFEMDEDKEKLHEAGILAVDSTKSNTLLNWSPIWDTEKAIEMTIDWYKLFLKESSINTANDIREYVAGAKEQNLTWAGK
jgi:CDP-glucose 4,6-dehydratase